MSNAEEGHGDPSDEPSDAANGLMRYLGSCFLLLSDVFCLLLLSVVKGCDLALFSDSSFLL